MRNSGRTTTDYNKKAVKLSDRSRFRVATNVKEEIELLKSFNYASFAAKRPAIDEAKYITKRSI